jgi:hypothetical protein
VSSCWQIQQVRTGRDVSVVEGGVVLGETSEAWRVGLFISIGSVFKEFVDDDSSGDCWVGEEFLCSEGEDRRDEAWDGADAMAAAAAGKESQNVAGSELGRATALRICADLGKLQRDRYAFAGFLLNCCQWQTLERG